MKLGEKVSYLKGLMEGMELDEATKEGKLLALMADILQDVALHFEDVQDQLDELVEVVDAIDDDLLEVEEDLYGEPDGDEDTDEDFPEEELYEVCCPTCGNSIRLNEDMLGEGSINCPNCGETLEFDFSSLDQEEE